MNSASRNIFTPIFWSTTQSFAGLSLTFLMKIRSGFWLSQNMVQFAGVVPAYTSDTTLLPNFSYSVVSQQVYQTLFQYSKVLQPEQGALI